VTEREKLLRDIETLKESVRLAMAELATAYTPGERHNLANHIRILQGELATLLQQAERLGTVSKGAPFNVGDRVRHQKFGEGTVTATPVAMVGADPDDMRKLRDTGWCVKVEWDDLERGETQVADFALQLLHRAAENR
jgi:hypothetical protein